MLSGCSAASAVLHPAAPVRALRCGNKWPYLKNGNSATRLPLTSYIVTLVHLCSLHYKDSARPAGHAMQLPLDSPWEPSHSWRWSEATLPRYHSCFSRPLYWGCQGITAADSASCTRLSISSAGGPLSGDCSVLPGKRSKSFPKVLLGPASSPYMVAAQTISHMVPGLSTPRYRRICAP